MDVRIPEPPPGASLSGRHVMGTGGHSSGGRTEEASLGAVIRSLRKARRMSLQDLAEAVRCAKSYLSTIENDRRAGPPGEAVLRRLEDALGCTPGRLVEAARWQAVPASVRKEVSKLEDQQQLARRLVDILSGAGIDEAGKVRGGLDQALKSGELRRLMDRLGSEGARGGGAEEARPVRSALPLEVPLINRVAAGYPREFTDLGYPARTADEYVRCPDLDDPDAFAARVVGDSMLPDFREGDVVVFSPARPVKSGMDCFARIEPDQETTFKRVYFEVGAEGEEVIRLQPLNSAYAPRTLMREAVAGLYAAVSVIRAIG